MKRHIKPHKENMSYSETITKRYQYHSMAQKPRRNLGRDVQNVGRVTHSRKSEITPTKECSKRNMKVGREQYMKPSNIMIYQTENLM